MQAVAPVMAGPTRWARLSVLAGLAPLLLLAQPAAAQNVMDHSRIVGPGECGECHKKTVAIWQETHHFKTFRDMPRRREAAEISEKMGLKRIMAGSLCLDCHFTTPLDASGERDPIAGISCESCHGPAKGYLKRHGEFSGKKKGQETPEEEARRWADSEAAGMIRPRHIYALAKNCYGCHTVPQEELVNRGGHPAGSDFELVSWSQGEVRHNVWYTDGKSNPEASAARKRLMFVVGLAVEIETALRAVGKATAKDKYAVAMARRADSARKRFAKVAEALSEPEVQEIAAASTAAALKLDNGPALEAAADRVAAATQQIAATYDGSGFAAIDALIPGPDQYKGPAVP